MYQTHRHVALNHFPVLGTTNATVLFFAIASLAAIINCIAKFTNNNYGKINEDSAVKKVGKSKKVKTSNLLINQHVR